MQEDPVGGDAEEVGQSNHSDTYCMCQDRAVGTDTVEVGPLDLPMGEAQEATCVADEGEQIEALVEWMELGDRDYKALFDNEGSGDEQGGGDHAIPLEWNTY